MSAHFHLTEAILCDDGRASSAKYMGLLMIDKEFEVAARQRNLRIQSSLGKWGCDETLVYVTCKCNRTITEPAKHADLAGIVRSA